MIISLFLNHYKNLIMKSLYSPFVALFLCAIALVSCKNSSGNTSNIEKAVGAANINYRADKALYGLLGPVQTVTYADGYTLNFDGDGNIVGGYAERTRHKDHSRTDQLYDMTTETSTFDELGRVTNQVGSEYEQVYFYEEDHYYPTSLTGKYYEIGDDEPEEVTHTYSYTPKDFDEYGNWLSRMDNEEKVTRTITYWPDPYDIGEQPHYKSAVAVTKAIYKAKKAKDPVAYLGTYDYGSRVYYGMTLDFVKENFSSTDDNYDIMMFKVVDDEATSDTEHTVRVDVLTRDGEIKRWCCEVYKGDDGYWYNSGLAYTEKE